MLHRARRLARKWTGGTEPNPIAEIEKVFLPSGPLESWTWVTLPPGQLDSSMPMTVPCPTEYTGARAAEVHTLVDAFGDQTREPRSGFR